MATLVSGKLQETADSERDRGQATVNNSLFTVIM